MLIVLDLHSGVPTYRQILDQVRFQIASGRLADGATLPSTRVLAQQLGINPMTVSKAYGLLEAEGLVEHHAGLPLTVIGGQRAPAAADAKREALRPLLEPVAVAAHQLGIRPAQAVALFRELLAAKASSGDTDRHDES